MLLCIFTGPDGCHAAPSHPGRTSLGKTSKEKRFAKCGGWRRKGPPAHGWSQAPFWCSTSTDGWHRIVWGADMDCYQGLQWRRLQHLAGLTQHKEGPAVRIFVPSTWRVCSADDPGTHGLMQDKRACANNSQPYRGRPNRWGLASSNT